MTRIEWFYAKQGKQFGPVSTLEIKQLADEGKLLREDLVWRVGMKGWTSARKVGGLFPEMPRGWSTDPAGAMAGPPLPTPGSASGEPITPPSVASPPIAPPLPTAMREEGRQPLDPLLQYARELFTLPFVDMTSQMFALAGHWLMYLAMLLWLALGIVIAAQQASITAALAGLIGVLVLFALQHVALRCSDALDRLNERTGGRMSSAALLDCCALLNFVAGLALLILFAAYAIQTEHLMFVAHGVAAFILFQFAAVVSLNPESLGIAVRADTGVREEAIGAAAFFLKLSARVVPVAFGVGVAVGTIKLLYAGYLVLVRPESLVGLTDLIGTDHAALAKAVVVTLEAGLSVAFYALLPLLGYLFFLAGYLLLDLVRAVLHLPGKLDRLAAKSEGEAPIGKGPDALR